MLTDTETANDSCLVVIIFSPEKGKKIMMDLLESAPNQQVQQVQL